MSDKTQNNLSRTATLKTIDDSCEPSVQPSVLKIFCEKVTIAGLEDIYTAKEFPTKLLFIIGIALSTAFCVLTSVHISQQFYHEIAPVLIAFKEDGKIRFPNVTICTTAVANVTAQKEMLVVPNDVKKKLQTLGIDHSKLMEEVVQLISGPVFSFELNKAHFRSIDKVLSATASQLTGGGRNILELLRRTLPPCPLTLSNCTYHGNQIDCCNGTEIGADNGFVCYGIPLSNIPQSYVSDKPILFNADVRMDLRHVPFVRGDEGYDGFLVIINEPFTPANTAPVAVSPGWHVTVKLSRIKKRYDRRNCWLASNLPKMVYERYYDEDGKNCEIEMGLVELHTVLQCTTSVGNYFPNGTEGCGFIQGYTALLGVHGVLDEIAMDIHANISMKTRQIISGYTGAYRKRMGSVTKKCLPICERWQYEPIVGYSQLQHNPNIIHSQGGNISWSRITVTIPSSYYEEYKEGEKSSWYIIMCNGYLAWGVGLGVSAVTIFQLIVYCLYICFDFNKKKRQVQPE